MTTPARPDQAANTTVFDEDQSIPVLTERLTLPALDLDFALPAAEPGVNTETPVEVTLLSVPQPPAPAPAPTAEELRDAVLEVVLARLPGEIETLVRHQMRPAIDAAIAHLSAEAGQALRDALVELVERAVREVLDKRSDPT